LLASKTAAGTKVSGTKVSGTKVSGIKVWLTPPPGWSAKTCKKKPVLSGTTNKTGHVKLSVCGAQSGIFTVHSKGAVSTGTMTLRVKHSRPLPPVRASASSSAQGELTASWSKPAYAGGVSIASYRLTASATGQPSTTVTLSAAALNSGLRYTFTGLARAVAWKVSVQAVTKYGVSDAQSASVRTV
jgi:hypothetical protein